MKKKNFYRFVLVLLLVAAPVFSRERGLSASASGADGLFENGEMNGLTVLRSIPRPAGWPETTAGTAVEKSSPVITFSVTVPANTPVDDMIYIAGNLNFWDPGPGQTGTDGQDHDLAMQPMDDLQWELDVPLESGQALEYKYTRGSWAQVEKGDRGQELPNRRLTVPDSDFIQIDVVARWADTGTGVADNTEVPSSFQLEQNYPNPFNSGTVIRYQIPAAERVRLSLVNLQGETVEILVDQLQHAGAHELLYRPDLPSGIYFYRILAGKDVATRKLILVR